MSQADRSGTPGSDNATSGTDTEPSGMDIPATAPSGTDTEPSGMDIPATAPSGTDTEPSATGPDNPPGADQPASPHPATSRRKRFAVFGGLAVIAGLGVWVVSGRDRAPNEPPPTTATADGGAAVAAPRRPQLPDGTAVALRGIVVDGTNGPVVGAVVTLERERDIVDRSLAGSGVGSAGVVGSGSATAATAPLQPIAAPATRDDGRFEFAGLAPGRYRIRVSGTGLVPAELRFVPVPSDEARIIVARIVAVEGVVRDGGAPVVNATVGLRGEAIGGALEMQTDAKGGFRFANLPEGRYHVFAYQAALAARAVRVNRLGVGPFTPVELTLEAAAIVVGRVIDREEGTGLVAAIELRPSGDDQAPRYARSGPDGAFRIEGVPRGRWIADAFSPGFLTGGGIEIEAGRGVAELALIRGATIEGRVVDSDGRPIAGATVRGMIGGPQVGRGPATQDSSPTEHAAAIDLDRLRRFTGRIAAGPPIAMLGTSADPLLVPRGELGVMVGPIPPIPPPGAQVARPAAIDSSAVGASAFVSDPPPLEIAGDAASIWVTGSDGRYRIRGLPRGRAAVVASAPGFAEVASRAVELELGQHVDKVDITLTAGTYLFGRVSDQHGIRVVGAQVHVKPALASPTDGFTDDEGNYRIGPFAGSLEVTTSAYGHADTRQTIELVSASGRTAGERRNDVVLVVADAIIAGTVDDAGGAPVAGARVEVVGGSSDGRQATVAADGTFSIERLAAGPLRVRVTHPAYPAVEIATTAAPDQPRVRLRVPLGGAIEGVLLDASSGAPLGGVIVSGYGPEGVTSDVTSEPNGRWRLGPLRVGRWKLAVHQPGFLEARREIDVPAARTPGLSSVFDLRIDLSRGAVVGGTVRDARGQRVANASVRVSVGTDSVTAITDSQGEFRVRDAPIGEVTIEATKQDQRGMTKATLRAGDEVLGLSIELGR